MEEGVIVKCTQIEDEIKLKARVEQLEEALSNAKEALSRVDEHDLSNRYSYLCLLYDSIESSINSAISHVREALDELKKAKEKK
jgi:prefoldin subunit 5